MNSDKVILLVEDNEMNRDMLSRRLTKRGHEVIATARRPEVLADLAFVAVLIRQLDAEADPDLAGPTLLEISD